MRIGCRVGVLAGDPGVHVEEVAVAWLSDGGLAEAVDRLGEVQVHAQSLPGPDAACPRRPTVLALTGGDVAGDEVAEGRVDALEEVVAVGVGDVRGGPGLVAALLGHPDAAVVAQRLRS
jgi:hypothetical protein